MQARLSDQLQLHLHLSATPGLDDVEGARNKDSKEQDSEHQGTKDINEGVNEGVDEGVDEGVNDNIDESVDESV